MTIYIDADEHPEESGLHPPDRRQRGRPAQTIELQQNLKNGTKKTVHPFRAQNKSRDQNHIRIGNIAVIHK